MNVFVTGCLGYIGSHTCVELLNKGYSIVGLDDLSNSKISVIDGIKKITGKDIKFYQGTMLDEKILDRIFEENKIDYVIDFAAFKAVGESVSKPLEYYRNNVETVLNLLNSMKNHNVKKLVFSSSCTVYGNPERIPVSENSPVGKTTNPYGTSKYMVEQILTDLYNSDPEFGICILRYFNPIGAHESGIIGEDPNGTPPNLMPYITGVASGKMEYLSVFGGDYNTPDGTCLRDYVHVVDIAEGHVLAIEKIQKEEKGLFKYNLGMGIGVSVLDIINTFEKVTGQKINYKITDRRPGDAEKVYCDASKAKEELGFECKRTLEDMMRDSWNFEKNKNNK